jgi:hypothetical protein
MDVTVIGNPGYLTLACQNFIQVTRYLSSVNHNQNTEYTINLVLPFNEKVTQQEVANGFFLPHEIGADVLTALAHRYQIGESTICVNTFTLNTIFSGNANGRIFMMDSDNQDITEYVHDNIKERASLLLTHRNGLSILSGHEDIPDLTQTPEEWLPIVVCASFKQLIRSKIVGTQLSGFQLN